MSDSRRQMPSDEVKQRLAPINQLLRDIYSRIDKIQDAGYQNELNNLFSVRIQFTPGTLKSIKPELLAEIKLKLNDYALEVFENGTNDQDADVNTVLDIEKKYKEFCEAICALQKAMHEYSFTNVPADPDNNEFDLTVEMENAAKLLKEGDHALPFIESWLSDSNVRARIFDEHEKVFKRNIYKKSIANMARSFIRMHKDIFCNINAGELYNGKFDRAAADQGLIPTIWNFTQHTNQLIDWISSDILKSGDIDQIAFACDYWINVAYECVVNEGIKDSIGANAIFSALESEPVRRLLAIIGNQPNRVLSEKSMARLNALKILFDSNDRHQAFRQYMVNNPDALMTPALLQTHVTMQYEKNPPDTALIHSGIQAFQKRQQMIRLIEIPDSIPEIIISQNIDGSKILNKNECDAVSEKLTVRENNEPRKLKQSNPIYPGLQDQLNKVAIQRKETSIDTSDFKKSRQRFPDLFFTNFTSDADLNQGIQILVYGKAHITQENSRPLNLLAAADDLCKKCLTVNTSRLFDAPPLLRAIALVYYLANTPDLSDSDKLKAQHWLKTFKDNLTIDEDAKYTLFLKTHPDYEKAMFPEPSPEAKPEEPAIVFEDMEFTALPGNASAFPPLERCGNKERGANDSGEHGGLYRNPKTRQLYMIKRDTADGKARVAKIFGEYVAGRLVYGIMQQMHPEDQRYSDSYVAKVSLVSARVEDADPGKEDELVYLKSEYLKNVVGDLWEVAHIEHVKKELIGDPANKAMTILELNKMAKEIVKKKFKDHKPSAVIASTKGALGFTSGYESEAIKVPSDFILEQPGMLDQFCEMVAARIQLADFGVHHGNFVVMRDRKNPDLFRLGAIDFGAAFDGFPNEIQPFNFKDKLLEYYKNHLLEYDPKIIYGRSMALAFIKAASIHEDKLEAQLENIIQATKEHVPYSLDAIKEFCARVGMEKNDYINFHDKHHLLEKVRDHILQISKERNLSLMKKGLGLLLENCFVNDNGEFDKKGRLDTNLLKQYLAAHSPYMENFLSAHFDTYTCVRIHDSQKQIILDAYREIIDKSLKNIAAKERAVSELEILMAKCGDTFRHIIQLNDELTSTDPARQLAAVRIFNEMKYSDKLKLYFEKFTAVSLSAHAVTSNELDLLKEGVKTTLSQMNLQINQAEASIEKILGKNPNATLRGQEQAGAAKKESTQPTLTIAMLGTNEHRDNVKTILTQFHKAIKTGPNRSVYLIDGPGGKPNKMESDPMLGTYSIASCERDPQNGIFTVLKKPKSKSEKVASLTTGIAGGAGTDDAIQEALLVVEKMLGQCNEKPLIINLAGYSRGADNCIRLANALAERYARDEVQVNIFAIDPVPGPQRMQATRAQILPNIVNNYEAILMRDEKRQALFAVRDKRELTVQNPAITRQRYHLYHGEHSQADYLRGTENEYSQPNNAAARLAWNDLYSFAEEHGSDIDTKRFDYVSYDTPEKTTPFKPLEIQEQLASYTKMYVNRTAYSPSRGNRPFTRNTSDYFLHGEGYFIDREHMALFNAQYPKLFDRLFQDGMQFSNMQEALIELGRELEKVCEDENKELKASLEDFFQIDISPSLAPPKKGIRLVASEFYQPSSTLYQTWEGFISLLKELNSINSQEVNRLYDQIKNIIIGDEPYKETMIAHHIRQFIKNKSIPDDTAKKINDFANRIDPDKSNKTEVINASALVYAKLSRFLGKNKGQRIPQLYQDIVNAFARIAGKLDDHSLGNDTALINELLNEALRAIGEAERKDNLGELKFKRQLRQCIKVISTSLPPARRSPELEEAAAGIKLEFKNDIRKHLAAPVPAMLASPAKSITPAAPKLPVGGMEPIPNPEPAHRSTVSPGMSSTAQLTQIIQNFARIQALLDEINGKLDRINHDLAASAAPRRAVSPSPHPVTGVHATRHSARNGTRLESEDRRHTAKREPKKGPEHRG